ncbi:hypothetical protein Tco_0540483 [Tanacetum coccineum]
MAAMCRAGTSKKYDSRNTSRFMRDARRTTVSGIKDHKARVLLAIYAQRCKGINSEMRSLPNTLTRTKKTKAGNDTHNISMALLPIRDRHHRTIANSTGGARTTPKSSNAETSFSLVYGSEAVILIEINEEFRILMSSKTRKNKEKTSTFLRKEWR